METKDLKIFIHIPELQSDRLTLRKIVKSDLEDVYEYSSDAKVAEYLLWPPHESRMISKLYLSIVENKYRRAEFYDWGIEYRGKMIGTCGFTTISTENNAAEIGFVLNRSHWGHGIAREAALTVMEYGFNTLRLNRIEARIMVDNLQSHRVLEKCRMKFEGIHKEAVLAKGRYRDIAIFAITASEYFEYKNLGVI